MKSASTGRAFLSILFLFEIFSAPAQFNIRKMEFGADINTFLYQGDLTPSKLGSFKTMTVGPGAYANYKLNRSFSVRSGLILGRIAGDESKYTDPAYRQQRNFSFSSPVTEISSGVVWNILPPANEGGPGLTPYIFAGIGYTFLHIKRDYSNYNAAYFFNESGSGEGLAADAAHSLPKGLVVFPVAAGLRYAFTKNLSLTVSTAYRFNSTDYLDGFSKAANPSKKDHFFTNAIGLLYNFGKNDALDCPKKVR